MSRLRASQKAYREYLQTEHWEVMREAALHRDGRKCKRCGSDKQLQVHHLVYRKRWEEAQLADLETLCRSCHRTEHGLIVWTQFDFYLRELERRLNQSTATIKYLPSVEEERELVKLIEYEDQVREVEAFFRTVAKTRIKLWTSWLQKSGEVTSRLWPWARAKRLRIESELWDEILGEEASLLFDKMRQRAGFTAAGV